MFKQPFHSKGFGDSVEVTPCGSPVNNPILRCKLGLIQSVNVSCTALSMLRILNKYYFDYNSINSMLNIFQRQKELEILKKSGSCACQIDVVLCMCFA